MIDPVITTIYLMFSFPHRINNVILVVSLPCQVMVVCVLPWMLHLSSMNYCHYYLIGKLPTVSIKLEVVGCVYLNKDHVEFCDVHTLLLKTQKQAIFKRLNFTRFDYMQCRIKPEKNKVESDGHCTSTLTGSEEVLIIKPTTYFLIPVKFRKVCIRERKF